MVMNVFILVVSLLLSDGDAVVGSIQFGNEEECLYTQQSIYDGRLKGYTVVIPCKVKEK